MKETKHRNTNQTLLLALKQQGYIIALSSLCYINFKPTDNKISQLHERQKLKTL